MSCPTVREVVAWLDGLLDPTRRDDYGPNGLQVDASPSSLGPTRQPAATIVTGVTANLTLIEAAIERGADLLVVHHGLYWHGAPSTAVGPLGRRLARCFESNLSVAAYHLPLDAHPEVGNAAGLAALLGLRDQTPAFLYKGLPTGLTGRFPSPLTRDELEERLRDVSPRAMWFAGGPDRIATVGIVTGGAPRLASEAAGMGLDLYITGECSEYTQATAHEERIHIAACGHHRSEVFGAMLLAERLKQTFPGVEVEFVDVDNPA
jgi:dinuclear metal center YbgI/SA1388 family protein